jgi:hypothetical protein
MWLFAFGIYASTASPYLHGYDPQAAATAQGFFEDGHFEFPRYSLYATPPDPGADGKLVSRVGLPQALLMVPFYGAGAVLDDAFPRAEGREPFAALGLGFYEPFVAACAAALFALVVLRLRRSLPWAVAGGILFTVASIAWPYSKIGMETTVMLGMLLLFAGVVHAEGGSWRPWAVAGFGAGMTVAAKAYELVAVAVLLSLLVPALRSVDTRRRRTLIAAVLVPAAVWMLAVGWYNWSRFGSPFEFGQAAFEWTAWAPVHAIGFLVSPGKGLLWYSPLALLGLLGLKSLAAHDRRLARTVVIALAAAIAVVAVNTYWTDETWGPRYLVPVAWMLLLPLPFWAVTRRRQVILGGVAVVAVAVQFVGVVSSYESGLAVAQRALGFDPIAAMWGEPAAPLGHDTERWVPGASPLVAQGALVASWAATGVGLPPVTYTYHPRLGESHSVTIHRKLINDLGVPDFWWLPEHNGPLGLTALLAAAAALLAALHLTRAAAADPDAPDWMRRRVGRRGAEQLAGSAG